MGGGRSPRTLGTTTEGEKNPAWGPPSPFQEHPNPCSAPGRGRGAQTLLRGSSSPAPSPWANGCPGENFLAPEGRNLPHDSTGAEGATQATTLVREPEEIICWRPNLPGVRGGEVDFPPSMVVIVVPSRWGGVGRRPGVTTAALGAMTVGLVPPPRLPRCERSPGKVKPSRGVPRGAAGAGNAAGGLAQGVTLPLPPRGRGPAWWRVWTSSGRRRGERGFGSAPNLQGGGEALGCRSQGHRWPPVASSSRWEGLTTFQRRVKEVWLGGSHVGGPAAVVGWARCLLGS